MGGALASPAIATDVFSDDANDNEQYSTAPPSRQDLARKSHSLEVYCNTAQTIGAPFSDDGAVVNSTSVNAMVQVPPGDATSPHVPPAVSIQLAPLADERMVAGPSAIQETGTVSEVEIGPEITLGFQSVADYNFIISLDVIEEQ
ncbi:hypothetical protein KC19_2G051300 [Ceratodon purpureus]|uniref:Uncharacterized protein n=1 Tax=Ceratodon purpureus TaxID=3225 RepID=A0A8T0IT40_CERPU|nr:hypothetical protein KC19_2G051300 [Ceratodon purpureus]